MNIEINSHEKIKIKGPDLTIIITSSNDGSFYIQTVSRTSDETHILNFHRNGGKLEKRTY